MASQAEKNCPVIPGHPMRHSRICISHSSCMLASNPYAAKHFAPRCRRRFAACPQQLRDAGRADDAALFGLDTPNVTLANTCDFRRAATLLQNTSSASCPHFAARAMQHPASGHIRCPAAGRTASAGCRRSRLLAPDHLCPAALCKQQQQAAAAAVAAVAKCTALWHCWQLLRPQAHFLATDINCNGSFTFTALQVFGVHREPGICVQSAAEAGVRVAAAGAPHALLRVVLARPGARHPLRAGGADDSPARSVTAVQS